MLFFLEHQHGRRDGECKPAILTVSDGKCRRKRKKIGQKWTVQGFGQLQRGILTNDNFIKFINLAKIFKKFGNKLNRMTKEACR